MSKRGVHDTLWAQMGAVQGQSQQAAEEAKRANLRPGALEGTTGEEQVASKSIQVVKHRAAPKSVVVK